MLRILSALVILCGMASPSISQEDRVPLPEGVAHLPEFMLKSCNSGRDFLCENWGGKKASMALVEFVADHAHKLYSDHPMHINGWMVWPIKGDSTSGVASAINYLMNQGVASKHMAIAFYRIEDETLMNNSGREVSTILIVRLDDGTEIAIDPTWAKPRPLKSFKECIFVQLDTKKHFQETTECKLLTRKREEKSK